MSTEQSPRLGFGLALCAAACWAFTGPGITYVLDTYHVLPLTLAFWRDVFTVLVLLPVVLWRFGLPRRRDLGRFAVVGVVCIGLYHALWVTSVQLNGPAVAVVLIYTFPAFATLGAWRLWGERPTRAALVGLLVTFAGCLLVVRAYDPAMLRLSWRGIVCGVATGVSQAAYSLYSRRALRQHHPWATLAWTFTFGTLALLLTRTPATIGLGSNPAPWLLLAALAIGPTLIGYVLYSSALRSLPAGVAGTVVTLEAPIAALLAWTLLGQRLEAWQVLGIALVLLGVAAPQLWPARRAVTSLAAEA